ncbi:hypothetical protein B0T17DRAFT_512242 [Bombardia bombarda]|uniref:Uncharacterized protein n=1 Tax=Bombardia bombarda TaxID=252184 RepID=A0AA39TLW6_9PEZI|nr:hypothetical protein B0T17DRAFT_512242 [Bombardia bombarda]
MASLNPGRVRFHAELEHLTKLFRNEPDGGKGIRNEAREVLMWLSVAERPVRTHALWISVQITTLGHKDLDHFALSLLSDSTHADDVRAMYWLQNLLGGMLSFSHKISGTTPNIFVTLSDPELPTLLPDIVDQFINLTGNNLPARHLEILEFSPSAAHFSVGSVCTLICAMSTLYLAHVHDETAASSLILYAWGYWSFHLSRLTHIDDLETRRFCLTRSLTFAFKIHEDVRVALFAVLDFLTGPITVSANEDEVGFIALVMQAQEVVEKLYRHWDQDFSNLGNWQRLEDIHQIFQSPGYSEKTGNSPLKSLPPGMNTRSGVKTLRIDKLLAYTQSLMDQQPQHKAHWRLVLWFAEAAREVRGLCILLAQPPLYEQLQKHCGDWSPLDLLVNIANWAEDMASFSSWDVLPFPPSRDLFPTPETSDPDHDTAQFIVSQIKGDGPQLTEKNSPSVNSKPTAARRARTRPVNISPVRWYAARTISTVKSHRSTIPGSTFTINDTHSQHKLLIIPDISPSAVFTGGLSLIERACGFSISERLLTSSGHRDRWPDIKSAIFEGGGGHRKAFVLLVIATILHHIRGILLPAFSVYWWNSPLGDLRLALSNPDYFLDHALSYSWFAVVRSYALEFMHSWFAARMIAYIAGRRSRLQRALAEAKKAERAEEITKGKVALWKMERALEGCTVGYMVWALNRVEYMFVRSVYTYALVVACYKLRFAVGDIGRAALGKVLMANWTKVPFTVCEDLWYWGGEVMLRQMRTSFELAWSGRPWVLGTYMVCVGMVAAVLRYRSTIFIALEFSGLFVLIAFLLAGLGLVVIDFVEDPVELSEHTRVRRRSLQTLERWGPDMVRKRDILIRKKEGFEEGKPVDGASLSEEEVQRKKEE